MPRGCTPGDVAPAVPFYCASVSMTGNAIERNFDVFVRTSDLRGRLRKELRTKNFAVMRARQSFHKTDCAWLLVAGQTLPTVFDQLLLGSGRAAPEHDERRRHLAPFEIGKADDRNLGDRGMCAQHVLDLLRHD